MIKYIKMLRNRSGFNEENGHGSAAESVRILLHLNRHLALDQSSNVQAIQYFPFESGALYALLPLRDRRRDDRRSFQPVHGVSHHWHPYANSCRDLRRRHLHADIHRSHSADRKGNPPRREYGPREAFA